MTAASRSASSEPPHLKVWNPADGSVVAELATATPAVLEEVIRGAALSIEQGDWANASMENRAAVMEAVAAALHEARHEFVETIVAETGCPIALSEAAQVDAAITDLGIYVEHARRSVDVAHTYAPLAAHLTPEGLRASVRTWAPVGVVAALIPYNFPLFTTVMKVAPALLAGCSVIVRPSPLAPLAIERFVRIAQQSGLPPRVLQIVTEEGTAGAQRLCADSRVDMVSFTGSTEVGRRIAAQCAGTVKRLVLELGGKGAQVHLPDSLSRGIEGVVAGVRAVWSGFSGQTCTALGRVLVPLERLQEVVDALPGAAGDMRLGDPLDRATEVGPVITAAHRDRINELVARSQRSGATLVTGGPDRPVPEKGHYVAPTALVVKSDRNPGAQEEFFGPCVTVQGTGRYRRRSPSSMARPTDWPMPCTAETSGLQPRSLAAFAAAR